MEISSVSVAEKLSDMSELDTRQFQIRHLANENSLQDEFEKKVPQRQDGERGNASRDSMLVV